MGTSLTHLDEQMENGGTDLIAQPEVFNRGEVDMQIATARRYKRSLKEFKVNAMSMACFDEETAASCFYAVPRGGKTIEGPSVRLAEIVLSAWGNMRAESKIVEVTATEVVAEGACWDLEKNVAIRTQVRRRITGKNGKRFQEDMIIVTGNAAGSIAMRNAIFKVIPGAYVRAIYHEARKVAIGDAKTLNNKRGEMIAYFAKMGIAADRVVLAIGRQSVEDVTTDDMVKLKGFANAIKEGEATVDECFPPPEQPKTLAEMRPKPITKPEEPAEDKSKTKGGGELIPNAMMDSLSEIAHTKNLTGARLYATIEQRYHVDDMENMTLEQGEDFAAFLKGLPD